VEHPRPNTVIRRSKQLPATNEDNVIERATAEVACGRARRAYEILEGVTLASQDRARAAGVLLEAASGMRRNGLLQLAIQALEESLRLKPESDMKVLLAAWRRQLREARWSMARKDAERSSGRPGTNMSSPPTFSPVWSARFSEDMHPEVVQALPNIALPVVLSDGIVISGPTGRTLVSLEVDSGAQRWESPPLQDQPLGYFSTPACDGSSAYVVLEGTLIKLDVTGGCIGVLQDERLRPVSYGPPLLAGGRIVVALQGNVLVCDVAQEWHQFLEIGLPDGDFLRPPILCGQEIVLISARGTVHHVAANADELTVIAKPARESGCWSAPSVAAGEIHCERVGADTRALCAWDSDTEEWRCRELVGESFCNPGCRHLNFSPVVCDGKAVISSHAGDSWYVASKTPMGPQIQTRNASVVSGPLSIGAVSHVCMVALGRTMVGISDGLKGFYWLNLDNHTPGGGIVPFNNGWAPLVQPIAYGDLLFFYCREGVQCYRIT